ncbi:MAG: hypothetical protein ACI4AB_11560, partial [Acetatifactor sp.]
ICTDFGDQLYIIACFPLPTPPFWLAIDKMVGCKRVTSKVLVIKQNTASEDCVSRLREVIDLG